MKKLLFIIIVALISCSISFGQNLDVNETGHSTKFRIMFEESIFKTDYKPVEFNDMVSVEVLKSYDQETNETGFIYVIYMDKDFKYDIDRSGQVDISDMVEMVAYMFGSPQ